MRGQIELLLERGIEAVQANEKERAREILTHVIELDQHNEQAWLWLSSVVNIPADKAVCLENALYINPENTYASIGLNHLRQQPEFQTSPPPTLLRLAAPSTRRGQSLPAAQASLPPTERVCPRCKFRNPGWVHLCDRCGTDLRQVNVRQAVSEASKPRGRSSITLLEAWGGAITFNRLYAFLPEVELASWGRSLMALIMAALFATIWRPMVSLVLRLATGRIHWNAQSLVNVLRAAGQTLLPILLLTLACLPIALLTWAIARLVGGKQGLKVHVHLTSVAFSAWVVLIALLASLAELAPYVSQGNTELPGVVQVLINVTVGLAGFIWLTQAIRTAHELSITRTILAALVLAVLGLLIFFGLTALIGDFTGILSN